MGKVLRNHDSLVKLARKHRTNEELIKKISIFNTVWWKAEKLRIKKRVSKQQEEEKK